MPYQCVNLDISFSEIFEAQKDILMDDPNHQDATEIVKKIQTLWAVDPKKDLVLPTFCVRSALDLYLQVRKFPKGSEVIMTSVNLPDMVQLIREHGLIPVPLDLDPRTMGPVSLEKMKELITPKTKAFIAAYIYGVKFDPKPYADLCEEHDIDFLEDVAQTFSGTKKWVGSPQAKLSMFSFGLIKVQTCLSGAVAVIRD